MWSLVKGWAEATVVGTVFVASAGAQVTYEGCVDPRGVPVASVPNMQLNDIAMARLGQMGEPLIIYNPRVGMALSPTTRVFFYWHECGHHALGHTLGRLVLSMEQESDCWSIRSLVAAGLFGPLHVRQVQDELAAFGRADWLHLPGPQRAINLELCLASATRARDSTTTSAR